MTVEWDTSELDEWTAELGRVPFRVLPAVRAELVVAGKNVQKDARGFAGGIKHAPHYPASITYDLGGSVTSPHVDVGPDKRRRQGPLGNILEYGTSKNGPIPHMRPAGALEEPRLVKRLEDVAVKVLGL